MKNRAKCRLCQSVIESFHDTDYVFCKCTEIYVDGGTAMRCGANDWNNFLRVDELGNVVVVKVEDELVKPLDIAAVLKPTKEDLIRMLQDMADNIEKMPSEAMRAPISHFDHWSLILLLISILQENYEERK